MQDSMLTPQSTNSIQCRSINFHHLKFSIPITCLDKERKSDLFISHHLLLLFILIDIEEGKKLSCVGWFVRNFDYKPNNNSTPTHFGVFIVKKNSCVLFCHVSTESIDCTLDIMD
ncbi:hypothetical protein BLOT_012334 [Blomia tropicalis]|nr:hypothetical protein BLOT_012334 [Blomia tropicalis]